MKDDLDIPEPPSDARSPERSGPPESRCDNYDEYLEDTLGYAYGVRDIVPVGTLRSHDRLREDPETHLGDRSLQDLSDLEKLGLARGLKRNNDLDGFASVIEDLIHSDGADPGVDYPEIPLLGALVMHRSEHFRHARAWLDQAIEKWPDRSRSAKLLKGRVLLNAQGGDAATEHYEALVSAHPDDPELSFEIAEDLAAEGKPELATRWLGRARQTAEDVGDRAILVDIEVLESRLSGARDRGELSEPSTAE